MISLNADTVLMVHDGYSMILSIEARMCRQCRKPRCVFINRHGETRCEPCDYKEAA